MRIAWGFAGLVLILGLALCLLWALRDPEVAPRAASGDPPPPSAERPDSAPVGPQVATTTPRSPLAVRPYDPDGPPAPDDPDALRVLVVDRQTALPVSGAEVMWVNGNSAPVSIYRADDPSTLIYDPSCTRNRTRADAGGIAMVRTGPALWIAARSDDRFGERRFETAPSGEVRLPITSTLVLRAQVVDARDTPVAGVDVTFFIKAETEGKTTSWGCGAQTRGPQGLAVAVPSSQMADLRHATGTVRAEVLLPLRDTVRKVVPLSAVGPEPIRLVLPPTEAVTVRLRDPEGRPLADPVDVCLSLAAPPRGPSDRAVAIHRAPIPARVRNAIGTARFTWVQRDTEFVVSARSDRWQEVSARATAHFASGADLDVDLQFQHRQPRVCGRLLGPNDEVLAHRRVGVDVVAPEMLEWHPPIEATTDRDGRFSFPLDRGATTGGADLVFEVGAGASGRAYEGGTAVTELPPQDQVDLGDIRLGPPEVMAQGIVVDERGAALGGATVQARVTNASLGSGASRVFSSTGRLWRTGAHAADPNGNFVIPLPSRAPSSHERIVTFDLHAAAPGFIETESPPILSPGASDVHITLTGAGSIAGMLARDGRPPVWWVKVRAQRSSSPNVGVEDRPQDFEDCVNSDGTFDLGGLLPGMYDLTFTVGNETEPRAKIDGVIVVRLETTRDPRLENLRLAAASEGR